MKRMTHRALHRRRRTTSRRAGFSLLEIVVVLAVFVMITSIAIPAVQRAFSGQHLRAAADVVRSRFSEARVNAIETGDIYGLFYMPGQGDYFVAPMTQGFRSIQSGRQPNSEPQILENGIVFAAGETVQDSRSIEATENSTQQYGSMRPVLFYPDGTSQDAVVLLQSERTSAMIQVELRGLTGTSSKSRILDPAEVQQ